MHGDSSNTGLDWIGNESVLGQGHVSDKAYLHVDSKLRKHCTSGKVLPRRCHNSQGPGHVQSDQSSAFCVETPWTEADLKYTDQRTDRMHTAGNVGSRREKEEDVAS